MSKKHRWYQLRKRKVDRITNPVVRNRRIGKLQSWYTAGRSEIAIVRDVSIFLGMAILIIGKWNGSWAGEHLFIIPDWFLGILAIALIVGTIYCGYWVSEKGWRKFRNLYESFYLNPVWQLLFKKLGIKIDKEEIKKIIEDV